MAQVLERVDEEIAKPAQPRAHHQRSASRQSQRSKAWSDDDYDDDVYDDEEDASPLLDFQIALSIAIEALGQAMSSPWPNISQIARLSPEILSVPSSDDNSSDPAQVIVLTALLPSLSMPPDQPGSIEKSKNDIDMTLTKPPAPFTFTPLSLFSSAQTMLIRGRGAEDFAREVRRPFRPFIRRTHRLTLADPDCHSVA